MKKTKPYSMIINIDLYNAIKVAALKDGRSVKSFIMRTMAKAIKFEGDL